MIFGLDSEYQKLSSVLLYKPSATIANHPAPAKIQHFAAINHEKLTDELHVLIERFSASEVDVTLIEQPVEPDDPANYNMMFCRDLLFMTPQGAILASMANSIRRGEVIHAEKALARAGIPLLHRISGNGRFEGADALWINERLVAVGVGNRTNSEAFGQIRKVLALQGVKAVLLASTQNRTQHLLGSLQIVDRDLALVREEIISAEVMEFLANQGFRVVPIPENPEIRSRQAMNIVTIAPSKIFMTAGCPQTKTLYEKAGIEVAAELHISQLINGAGGLACATGTLARVSL
ncbi:MAG: hypothetical protein HXX17_02060 [Geobacteraceae bacterium]|nr:hypothetical protein [Geobacteraceae bacterium]